MLTHFRILGVSTVAFTVVWALNELVLSSITPALYPDTWWIIKAAAALGVFALVFEGLVYFLQTSFALRNTPEGKLTGEWFQIFEISNYEADDPLAKIRHGAVSIEFHNNNLEISSESARANDPSKTSQWYSNQVSVRGRKLWLMFQSSGPGRGSTLGTMELYYQGSTPVKLSGTFHDASPAKHFGTVEIYRHDADYRARLEQVIQGRTSLGSGDAEHS